MPSALTAGEDAKRLPRYRLVRSLPHTIVSLGATLGLALYMTAAGRLSFGALQRVLTCAPIKTITGADLGDALDSGSRYEDDIYSSVADGPKGCIPAEAHASWLPAGLAMFSMVALAVLALILVCYLLHMTYRYVYHTQENQPTGADDNRAWQNSTRGLFIIPDALKIAMKGLVGASGIFMLAAVGVYCLIFLIALT